MWYQATIRLTKDKTSPCFAAEKRKRTGFILCEWRWYNNGRLFPPIAQEPIAVTVAAIRDLRIALSRQLLIRFSRNHDSIIGKQARKQFRGLHFYACAVSNDYKLCWFIFETQIVLPNKQWRCWQCRKFGLKTAQKKPFNTRSCAVQAVKSAFWLHLWIVRLYNYVMSSASWYLTKKSKSFNVVKKITLTKYLDNYLVALIFRLRWQNLSLPSW